MVKAFFFNLTLLPYFKLSKLPIGNKSESTELEEPADSELTRDPGLKGDPLI